MGTRNTVPKGADCIAELRAHYEDGDTIIRVHQAYASQGYKTDYDRVLTRWMTGEYAAGEFRCWQYSGGRLATLAKLWHELVTDDDASTTVTRALPGAASRQERTR